MRHPRIESWCDVSYLHTKWKCPNGCPNGNGEDKAEVCDHGRVTTGEKIEFDCYHCGYSSKYNIKIKLVEMN